jgi:tRNA threonylcarbamoyladenosine biosynthesis protein TsaE
MKHDYSITVSEAGNLAKQLARNLRGGDILALSGPLGAGKTTFTQKLGKLFGIKKRITSPTFTLVNFYQAKLPKTKLPITFYHLDLYRTNSFQEVNELGLEEFMGQEQTITVIEWAEKIKAHLPKNTIWINFKI